MPTAIDGKLKWSPEELKTENAILRGNLDALIEAGEMVLRAVIHVSGPLNLESTVRKGHWVFLSYDELVQLKRALARARGAPASEWRD